MWKRAPVAADTKHAAGSSNAPTLGSQPFGVAVREITATLGLKRKMSDKWIAHANTVS